MKILKINQKVKNTKMNHKQQEWVQSTKCQEKMAFDYFDNKNKQIKKLS